MHQNPKQPPLFSVKNRSAVRFPKGVSNQNSAPTLRRLNHTFLQRGNETGLIAVDVYEIEERFRALDVSVDWKRLRKVVDMRNNIES